MLMSILSTFYDERIAQQNDDKVVTCVFCGFSYKPGTPQSNHEALRSHVAVCELHPAAAFRQRAEIAEAEIERLKKFIKHLASG